MNSDVNLRAFSDPAVVAKSTQANAIEEGKHPYEIVEYSANIVDAWNRFVDNCDEAWLYHRSIFVVPNAMGWEDKSFALTRGGDIVAVCAVAVQRKWFGRILTGPGPAIASGPAAEETRRFAFAMMEELAKKNGCVSVRIHRSSLPPRFLGARYIESDLSDQGYSLGLRGDSLDFEVGAWAVADLRCAPGEILKSFTKGNKAAVRKCERLEIRVVAYDCKTLIDKAWDEFEAILDETFVRAGIGKFSRARFDSLRSQVGNGFALLFNAYEQQQCIASILCQYFKTGAYYEAGGCRARGLALGAMSYLMYAAMVELKGRGVDYFNIGSVVPCHKDTRLARIGDFKRRFANQTWDVLICEKILDRKRYWRKIVLVGAIRMQVADWALFEWARSAIKAVVSAVRAR